MSIALKQNISSPVDPRLWQEGLELVRQLNDANGMGVDLEIEGLVTALRLSGYSTFMSCGGHFDRRTTGPYVVIRSRATGEQAERAEREKDETKKQHHYRTAQRLAQQEVMGLKRLVEEVNEGAGVASRRSIMELRTSGHSSFRLCFVHSDFDELLDDAGYVKTLEARRSVINGLFLKLLKELGLEPEIVQST